jgi:predicted nucleotidyltransferase
MTRPRRKAVDAAIRSYVERATQAAGGELDWILLYGSQARGDARAASDIDLLAIIRRESPELRRALEEIAWQVQFEHNVVISDIIRTAVQWEQMKARGFPFYQSVQKEGVLLWSSTSAPTPAYA